jgi:peptide/nickel transport system permease protein
MFFYLLRRLAGLPLVLIGVSIVLFLLAQVIPSDPVRLMMGEDVPSEVRERVRKDMGLDDPLLTQYLRYADRVVHGDLGQSIRYKAPVGQMVMRAFPITLRLVISATIISILIAIPIGVLTAIKSGTVWDSIMRGGVLLGISTPSFYLGMLLILGFGFHLGWFPVAGMGDPPTLWHTFLPAFTLGFRYAGSVARFIRGSMLDVFQEDYIRASRGRGIPEHLIKGWYALKNALIPAITDLGTQLADMVGAVVLVETIFAWPGIGQLTFTAITWNDFNLIQGCILMLAAYAVIINLLADLAYSVVDPRVRVA